MTHLVSLSLRDVYVDGRITRLEECVRKLPINNSRITGTYEGWYRSMDGLIHHLCQKIGVTTSHWKDFWDLQKPQFAFSCQKMCLLHGPNTVVRANCRPWRVSPRSKKHEGHKNIDTSTLTVELCHFIHCCWRISNRIPDFPKQAQPLNDIMLMG